MHSFYTSAKFQQVSNLILKSTYSKLYFTLKCSNLKDTSFTYKSEWSTTTRLQSAASLQIYVINFITYANLTFSSRRVSRDVFREVGQNPFHYSTSCSQFAYSWTMRNYWLFSSRTQFCAAQGWLLAVLFIVARDHGRQY